MLQKFDYYLSDFVYQKIYEDLSANAKEVVKTMSQAEDDKTETIRRHLHMKSNVFSYYREMLLRSGVCEAPSYGHLSFRLPRFRKFVLTQMQFERKPESYLEEACLSFSKVDFQSLMSNSASMLAVCDLEPILREAQVLSGSRTIRPEGYHHCRTSLRKNI